MKINTTNEVINIMEEEIDNACSDAKNNSDYYSEQDEKIIKGTIMNKKRWIDFEREMRQ